MGHKEKEAGWGGVGRWRSKQKGEGKASRQRQLISPYVRKTGPETKEWLPCSHFMMAEVQLPHFPLPPVVSPLENILNQHTHLHIKAARLNEIKPKSCSK